MPLKVPPLNNYCVSYLLVHNKLQFRDLTQHILIISQCLGRNLGTVYLFSLCQGSNQGISKGVAAEGPMFKLTHVVDDRIQFLRAIGQKSPSVLVILTSSTCQLTSLKCANIEGNKQDGSPITVFCNLIMEVISFVRSKSLGPGYTIA